MDTPDQDVATQETSGHIGNRAVEIGTSLFTFALGAIALYDSVRLGFRWADDGPQAGYFPFYLGLILCAASLWLLARASIGRKVTGVFVTFSQFRLVLALFLPLAVYTLLIAWLGMYVASVAFIAYCMRRIGNYGWLKCAVIPLAVMAVFFLMFELWFRVPLPKGPLEAMLGLD
jgi:putative tricarboxylic transport membrane protein